MDSKFEIQMPKGIKINTAAFICVAFIFRLFILNAGALSAPVSLYNSASLKSNFALEGHTAKSYHASDAAGRQDFPAVEICEEDSDENNELKSNSLLFLPFFYSFTCDMIGERPAPAAFTPHFLSYISSHRYLALRVFRI